MIKLPENIDPTEMVGRGIFDSKKATQAAKGKVHPRIFRERTGIRELSVDRLSFGGHEELAKLHDGERPGQTFHGWASISAVDALRSDRALFARPIEPTNPYHAEIVLPDTTDLDADEEQDQHALNLAMMAVWQPRPQPVVSSQQP